MYSVRNTLKHRDALTDAEINALLAEYRTLVAEGEDPEAMIEDLFGLEPDYLYDHELWA